MHRPPAALPPLEKLDALRELERTGQLRALLALGSPLLDHFPDSTELLQMLGIAHGRLGEPARGAELLGRIVELQPENAVAHVNLSNCQRDMGDLSAAIVSLQRAIALNPGLAQAHNNLGLCLVDRGHREGTLQRFDEAIRLQPRFAKAHANRANLLFSLGRLEEAVTGYRQAIALDPSIPAVHGNLGVVLRQMGRNSEAIEAFSAQLERTPGDIGSRARRAYARARICDWDAVAEDAACFPDFGIKGPVLPPFMMIVTDDDPARQLLRARRSAEASFGSSSRWGEYAGQPPGARLRIGYFSADFHDHATMHLLARLFELHDRTAFEVHAFSFGRPADDGPRRRLLAAVEHFHDVGTLDDGRIVELARARGIDIAIDLKGYTVEARPALFARRVAPVQINYLGFPGTMGAPFIDYILADKIVIPPESRQHYSEAPIWLPHSYQVNDDRRVISGRPTSRAEHGLPAQGFIFASFNASYKLTPDMFAIVMRLLGRVDGSLFWLLGDDPAASAHLRRHAERAGIDPARLVFAPKIPVDEHLARQRLADLCLDTFVCNAHTTASDALWAGLPIVTMAGKSFAARVCASLLRAVGLPELVTDHPEEYERLALRLATDPVALADIRARLADQRGTMPLFDSRLSTRHIEQAYRQVHARHRAGLPPAPIEIQP